MALTDCRVEVSSSGRETVLHGSGLFPAAFYLNDMREVSIPWHWHDEWEIVAVSRGRALVSAGGSERAVNAGEGAFINSSVFHGIRDGSGDCVMRAAVFHPRLVGGSRDSAFWQSYVEPVVGDAAMKVVVLRDEGWHMELLESMLRAWRACAEETKHYLLTVRAELSSAIALLTEHCDSGEKRPSEKTARNESRIKEMVRFIENSYQETITVADIAASAAISEGECTRCFRMMTGASPLQYVRRFRFEQAKALLLTTDMKVADIACRTGFQDAAYFSKAFRDAFGCAPKQFRRTRGPGGQS